MGKVKRKPLPTVMPAMCGSCPFREGSEYAELKKYLTEASMNESRICHSTGTGGIKGRTGKPAKLCRGSRDFQLELMFKLGVISAPTDAAWAEAWAKVLEERQKQ